jgi:pimeloyl-ACP methyl ester carboxylesterase
MFMLTRRDLLQSGLAAAAISAADGPVPASAATTAHRIEGDGEPVLLIAGFSCDLSVWDFAAPEIVKQGFRTIRFNNPGVGHGAQFAAVEIDMAGMAEHVAGLIAELGLARVHVVGHSMGGQIAQELALAVPERVASLTLLSSWAKPSARLAAVTGELAALSGQLPPDQWQRTFLPWLLTDAAYEVAGLIDQSVKGYADNPDRLPPALLAAQADAIARSDTGSRLAGLRRPTLVAVGEEDILTPPALSRALHEAIAGSAFKLLPAGHGNIAQAAAEVSARVGAFLRLHPIT